MCLRPQAYPQSWAQATPDVDRYEEPSREAKTLDGSLAAMKIRRQIEDAPASMGHLIGEVQYECEEGISATKPEWLDDSSSSRPRGAQSETMRDERLGVGLEPGSPNDLCVDIGKNRGENGPDRTIYLGPELSLHRVPIRRWNLCDAREK